MECNVIHYSNHNIFIYKILELIFIFIDGIRRSRKRFPIDGSNHASKTHKIEKRNARERCRVRAVNDAFGRLRRLIPVIKARRKRVSKVKTLRKAVQYIIELQQLLKSYV